MSMKLKEIKVLIGIPTVGGVHSSAYDNRMEMMQYLGAVEVCSKYGITEWDGGVIPMFHGERFKFDLVITDRLLTPIARECIAQRAVDEGYDFLLFVDDDMLTPPNLFFQLYKHKKDVVGALAFTRNPPHRPVLYRLETGFDKGKKWYSNYPILDYPKDCLVKCDAVGFGAVLIDTKVFKGMKGKWFTTTSGKGEDIYFCHNAEEKGFQVFMDTSCKLGHLGAPVNITEEYYEGLESSKIEELRDTLPEKKGVESC